jgi:hypothetical protein
LTGIFFLSLILLYHLTNECRGEKFQSHWKETAIVVDGSSHDWTGYPVSYYADNNIPLLLGVVNNDTTLNILLKIRDLNLARMLEQRGFVLWLNGKGKKKKNFGILYKVNAPIHPVEPPPKRNNEIEKPAPPDRSEFQPAGRFSLITPQDTTGFSTDSLGEFQGKVKIDEGAFCYEIVIPLQDEEGSIEKLTVSPKHELKFGMEVLSFNRPPGDGMGARPPDRSERPPDMEGSEGRPSSSPGMGGPGMPPGGRPGGGMPQQDAEEWWITIILAGS